MEKLKKSQSNAFTDNHFMEKEDYEKILPISNQNKIRLTRTEKAFFPRNKYSSHTMRNIMSPEMAVRAPYGK